MKVFSVFKRVFWLFNLFWATTKCEEPLLLNDDCFVWEGAKEIHVLLLNQIIMVEKWLEAAEHQDHILLPWNSTMWYEKKDL